MENKLKDKLVKIEKNLVDSKYPPQLVIENTSICNQKCMHCSHSEMKRENRHMDRDVWDKIVEEIGSNAPDTEIWPTFYGEALIMGKDNELWDRINYAESCGCENIVLNSNGMLLDRWNNIERILESPLKRFILSLDGFSKEVYEKIRVGGKRDAVYNNVIELLKRKEESGRLYPSITAQFSLMEENEHEVEEYRKFWHSKGAEVKVRPKLEWAAVGSIRSDRLDHDAGFRIACPWGYHTMAIHQDGNAVACAVDYDANYVAGNVKNNTVSELWDALDKNLRKPHREHRWDDIPEICKGCNDWQTAGAEYEVETLGGTRPFWFKDESDEYKI